MSMKNSNYTTLVLINERVGALVDGLRTEENLSTGRNSCPTSTLSTTQPALTGLGVTLGLRGEGLACDSLELIVGPYLYPFA